MCCKKRKTNLYLNCYKKYILIYDGAKIVTNVMLKCLVITRDQRIRFHIRRMLRKIQGELRVLPFAKVDVPSMFDLG